MATFRIDATPARLRSWIDRARKATAGPTTTARLGLMALLAGGVAVAGCLAVWSIVPADRVPLASGRAFRKADLDRIERALQAQGLDYAIDGRRVVVPGRIADAAAAAVAKLDLGPRTLDELRNGSAPSSWLGESSRERDERVLRDRAKIYEAMIDELPGIEDSFVSITPPERSRGSSRAAGRSKCLVRVQTEAGAELSPGTVETIISYLSAEPGLTRESFTIGDGEGRIYRDPSKPDLAALSTNRALEEELTRRILGKLTWIPDVQVLVKVEDPPASAEPPPAPRRAADSDEPGVSVGLNRAMEVEADEPPAPEAPAIEPARKQGGAWVFVPRSHYYNSSRRPGGGQPSHEDYIAQKNKTEQVIQTTVRLEADAADIDWAPTIVDVLPDEMPAETLQAAATPSRRSAHEWAVAGAAGAAAAGLVAVGTWIFGRQPARKSAPSRGDLRYHRGTPGTPAPTERVLEFVRRNPETAFSVLNRWTAQGGGRS